MCTPRCAPASLEKSKFPQVGSKQSKFHQEWWWPTPCAKDFLCWLKLDERLEPAVPNPGHAAGPSEQFPACFVTLPLQQSSYMKITSQYCTLLHIRILLLHHYLIWHSITSPLLHNHYFTITSPLLHDYFSITTWLLHIRILLLHHYYQWHSITSSLLHNHASPLLHHYFINTSLLLHHYFMSVLNYFIITSNDILLLHHYYIIITSPLLHHYFTITSSLLHDYYMITT